MPSSELAYALAAAESRYIAAHPQSARRHAEAAHHLPGGNTRTVLHYGPFPLTFACGEGNRLTDIDGRVYLDLLGEYSAGLYGHSDPIIKAAMRRAIDDGLSVGGPNVYEAPLADAICARFPSMDLIRFTNSGTEANLMALSLSRAVRPERRRVMVFGGAYHGGVFYFRDGHAQLNAPFEWLIGTYNDVEGTRALLREQGAAIAAVLVEPMLGGGCIPGSAAFLAMLRTECSAHDILLIFDEVMTSRLSPGGLQGLLGIRPDLTTLGKYLGGGASFGAFGGRRDLMQRFDPGSADSFSHAGTFNNNVLSMAGGLAGLTQVFTENEARRTNTLGDRLREQLNAAAASCGVAFRATGVGSLLGIHIGKEGGADVQDGEMLVSLFHLEMIARGFYFGRRGYIALSLPTTARDCDEFAAAVSEFFREHAPLFPGGEHRKAADLRSRHSYGARA